MQHFEKLAPDSAQHHFDNTLMVWPHGSEQLQNFFSHLNGSTTKIYRKHTYTGKYLNLSSNYPLYAKRG
jgi:hypothetical protein